jgi:hypothetical protein
MPISPIRATTVVVNVESGDNCFIATSSKVPGLHIWAETEQLLRERVIRAIQILFKMNRGMDVFVVPESDLDEFPELPQKSRSFIVTVPAH